MEKFEIWPIEESYDIDGWAEETHVDEMEDEGFKEEPEVERVLIFMVFPELFTLFFEGF